MEVVGVALIPIATKEQEINSSVLLTEVESVANLTGAKSLLLVARICAQVMVVGGDVLSMAAKNRPNLPLSFA